ncbi:MAG: LiaF domain-containing protein [Gemmatimonadales bacterium]
MTAARPLFLLAAAALAVAPPLGAQTWRTLTSARQRHGETHLAVSVNYVAGEFRLGAAPEGTLYRMDLRYDEDRFTPLREYDATGAHLLLGVRGRGHIQMGDHHKGGPVPSLDLQLAPDIPLVLDLDLGAVRSQVDLGGLALRSVRYRTGASETTLRFSRPNTVPCSELRLEAGAAAFHAWSLGNANCRSVHFEGGVGDVTLDFSGTWQGVVDADLNVAIGTLTLMLPRDAGVAVHLSRLLASFDQSGLERRGDTYYSAGYESARRRLVLDVSAAFGGINVVWTGPAR